MEGYVTECKDFSDMQLVGAQVTLQSQYCTVYVTSSFCYQFHCTATSSLNSQVSKFQLFAGDGIYGNTYMYVCKQTDWQGSSLHICELGSLDPPQLFVEQYYISLISGLPRFFPFSLH